MLHNFLMLACQALQHQCLQGYLYCWELTQLCSLCADNNSAAPPITPLLRACNIWFSSGLALQGPQLPCAIILICVLYLTLLQILYHVLGKLWHLHVTSDRR